MGYNTIQGTTIEANQYLNMRNALITTLIGQQPTALEHAELGIQYCNLLLNEADDRNKQILTLLQDVETNEKQLSFW